MPPRRRSDRGGAHRSLIPPPARRGAWPVPSSGGERAFVDRAACALGRVRACGRGQAARCAGRRRRRRRAPRRAPKVLVEATNQAAAADRPSARRAAGHGRYAAHRDRVDQHVARARAARRRRRADWQFLGVVHAGRPVPADARRQPPVSSSCATRPTNRCRAAVSSRSSPASAGTSGPCSRARAPQTAKVSLVLASMVLPDVPISPAAGETARRGGRDPGRRLALSADANLSRPGPRDERGPAWDPSNGAGQRYPDGRPREG